MRKIDPACNFKAQIIDKKLKAAIRIIVLGIFILRLYFFVLVYAYSNQGISFFDVSVCYADRFQRLLRQFIIITQFIVRDNDNIALFDASARMFLLAIQKNTCDFFCTSAVRTDFACFIDKDKSFILCFQNFFHNVHCIFHDEPPCSNKYCFIFSLPQVAFFVHECQNGFFRNIFWHIFCLFSLYIQYDIMIPGGMQV